MNGKEIFTAIYNHTIPEAFPSRGDEVLLVAPGERCMEPGGGKDWFGVHWTYFEFFEQTVTPGQRLLSSISNWEKEVKFPDLESFDWESDSMKQLKDCDPEKQLISGVLFNGHFERLHSLVGFEDALMAYYDDPEALVSFYNAVSEYKMRYMEILKEYYKLDLIAVHDDWGSNLNMFFSPDFWRECIKPEVKKLVDKAHSLGMMYEQHSCGMIEPIIPDLVELGINSLHPLQAPMNDRKRVKEEFGDRLVIRGGVNSQLVNSPDSSEDTIREELRSWLGTCAPGGGFIPHCTATQENVRAIIAEEIESFAGDFFS